MTLPEDERLTCRVCGQEAGIVPLVPGLLTLGHRVNPTFRSHYVRLAPAARNAAIPVAATEQPETPDVMETAFGVSRSQGSGVEPGSPRPSSAAALSASRRSV